MRIFILLIFCFIAAPALADTAACKRMASEAPGSLQHFKLVADRDYETENPGLGYGTRYEGPEGRLSVFYFDGGYGKLNPEIVRGYFDQAIKDLNTVSDRDGIALSKTRRVPVKDAKTIVGHFASVRDSTDRSHIVAMGDRNNCMVKFRFTGPIAIDASTDLFWSLMTQLDASF